MEQDAKASTCLDGYEKVGDNNQIAGGVRMAGDASHDGETQRGME